MKTICCKYYTEDQFFGDGIAYVEYDMDSLQPIRQVDDYGNILLYSFFDYNQKKEIGTCYVSEQIYNNLTNHAENVVFQSVFENKWLQAQSMYDERLDISKRHLLNLDIANEVLLSVWRQ
jgi:hypothetical protein